MAELNYKASNIAKAERLHSANFFKTLESFGEQSPSVSDILFVLEAGGLTEDEASAMLDNKGLVESIQEAIGSLTNAGFLGKSLNQAEVQKALSQTETSPTTGQNKKA